MKTEFEVCCSVCGMPGIGDIKTAKAQYYGGTVHKDPNICRENLKRKLIKNQPK